MQANYIDFREFVESSKESWQVLVDSSDNFTTQVEKLLEAGVKLPSEIDKKICLNYLMAITPMLSIAPILLLYGKEGTGKSTLTILASKLHKSPIFSSSSTFAAIRNHISKHKTRAIPIDSEDGDIVHRKYKYIEQDLTLLWDDVDPTLFTTDKNLYRMLKNGYNRETSKIQISSEKSGDNITFDCFALKIIGTVSNFSLDSRFREFNRRSIPIETKKSEQLFIPLDYSAYDWDGFNESFDALWNNAERIKDYNKLKSAIKLEVKSNRYKMSSNQLTISTEMITLGILSEVFSGIDDALTVWCEFWNRIADSSSISENRLKMALSKLIEDESKSVTEFNTKNNTNLPVTIKNSDIKAYLKHCLSNGDIDSLPLPKDMNRVLMSLGLAQDNRNNWKK